MRWFGPNDPECLRDIRQFGYVGVVNTISARMPDGLSKTAYPGCCCTGSLNGLAEIRGLQYRL